MKQAAVVPSAPPAAAPDRNPASMPAPTAVVPTATIASDLSNGTSNVFRARLTT